MRGRGVQRGSRREGKWKAPMTKKYFNSGLPPTTSLQLKALISTVQCGGAWPSHYLGLQYVCTGATTQECSFPKGAW